VGCIAGLVPGPWEGNRIKGAKNQSQIGKRAERKTLLTVLVALDNASAEHTAERFGFVLNSLGADMRLSITMCDNRREMALPPDVAKGPLATGNHLPICLPPVSFDFQTHRERSASLLHLGLECTF